MRLSFEECAACPGPLSWLPGPLCWAPHGLLPLASWTAAPQVQGGGSHSDLAEVRSLSRTARTGPWPRMLGLLL